MGILFSLLCTQRREKVRETNRKVILRYGKNVNPDASAVGDGIIGEDMSRDNTVVKEKKCTGGMQFLYLMELKSRTVYRGRFRDGQILIGRAENGSVRQKDGELFVEDSKVSHIHCCIFFGRDSCIIEDCHSTNHTWVNGMQVTARTELKNGDLLKLASRVYQVQFSSEHGQ